MVGIEFVRQPNGTYTRTDGDWPGNARAQIQYENTRFGNYKKEEAILFLEDAIAKNQVRKDRYLIVPNVELKQTKVQAEESTVTAAKEKKSKKRQDKKAATAAVEIATRATPKQRKEKVAAAQAPTTQRGDIDAEKVVQAFRNGTKIVDIAVSFGYARGQGQNRIRAILREAGAYTPKGGAQTTSDTNSSAS